MIKLHVSQTKINDVFVTLPIVLNWPINKRYGQFSSVWCPEKQIIEDCNNCYINQSKKGLRQTSVPHQCKNITLKILIMTIIHDWI